MNLYKIRLGDSEGCDNVDSLNVLAKDLNCALKKGEHYCKKNSSEMRKSEGKDIDGYPSNYCLHIVEIEKLHSIDIS